NQRGFRRSTPPGWLFSRSGGRRGGNKGSGSRFPAAGFLRRGQPWIFQLLPGRSSEIREASPGHFSGSRGRNGVFCSRGREHAFDCRIYVRIDVLLDSTKKEWFV